ncbi:MAG TPA: rhodanese-like domain-containing protein [Rhodanobacteraceae bacterium]|nr:rhodanese-like domain-containing protein [Rhodanobacteraceae bacterium]
MKPLSALTIGALSVWTSVAIGSESPPNPAIDMDGYLAVAKEAAAWRDTHRLSEAEFRRLSRLPDTIVLDARSAGKYAELHVRGAINLSFPDIAVDTLAQALPDKGARILIYCNNNFANAPGPFPTKLPTASLNLSTYVALYTYGYRNVYELGPQIDLSKSILDFETARH